MGSKHVVRLEAVAISRMEAGFSTSVSRNGYQGLYGVSLSSSGLSSGLGAGEGWFWGWIVCQIGIYLFEVQEHEDKYPPYFIYKDHDWPPFVNSQDTVLVSVTSTHSDQTLANIGNTLREGADMLGASSPEAGTAHTDVESVVEQQGNHSSDYAHPSTSHSDVVDGGKGMEKTSELSACEDMASPRLSYVGDSGYERPVEAMGRAPTAWVGAPNVRNDPKFSDVKSHPPEATEANGEGSQSDDKEEGRQTPLWSDMEDNGDLGPVPTFNNVCSEDFLPEQSKDEYIFFENVTHHEHLAK
ncbi:hypothetical protein P691DRAFT_783482, partial [Macrolepiota fuliginosa MF-IS2]